ncbi:Ribokinase-like protein [Fimicolochytrium jonesii]|uniref:Ribokinase-like protein n=1 Tax=Fimicolochytrium jonesii TaxID=1396493 RepID=UPI0022FEE9A2|nr:Ribokinase-like protein [Fimicolochytrium jonesii]KAI8815959.1 Ribokinase-like protein [Fimicolochytrium jonesii]
MSADSAPVFLGIGNPLLDMSAVVDAEFLKKYNLKSNDAILAGEEHKPLYKEMPEKYEVEYVAGGATQNSMRGAQWLLPAKSTVYIGCVGKDANAQKLREAAAKDGLRTEYLEDAEAATGLCAVLITGIERSLCTDLQAANLYKIDHLKKPEIWGLVESAKFYYTSGFFLTVSPPSAMLIAEHAAKTNKVFGLNLSAPFISQFFKEPLNNLLPYVDILFGNESEAEAYSTSNNWNLTDVSEIALKLASSPKVNASRSRLVVFTQGAHDTVVVQDGKVTKIPIIPIAREKIVDTNGAGDAFVGGFWAQYVQGKSLETAVKAGHYVANVVIQRSGPTYPKEAHGFRE